MKKIAIIIAILAFFTASTALALAQYKFAELGDYTILQNNFTDDANVKVSMFKQASTTCYILTSKSSINTALPTNIAISCVR